MSGDARAWQRMLSGRRLDLLDPSPLDIEFEDIAHGLARVARWNGQTVGDFPFSVAQHSLLVVDIMRTRLSRLDARTELYALLHDAPEYVIGDMISPFKGVLGGAYRDVEARLQRAIHLRAGLAAEPGEAIHKKIKAADRLSAYFEAVHLAGFEVNEARQLFGQPKGLHLSASDLAPRPTQEVERRFLEAIEAALSKMQDLS